MMSQGKCGVNACRVKKQVIYAQMQASEVVDTQMLCDIGNVTCI